jgi:hypothetical protein
VQPSVVDFKRARTTWWLSVLATPLVFFAVANLAHWSLGVAAVAGLQLWAGAGLKCPHCRRSLWPVGLHRTCTLCRFDLTS